MILHPGVCLLCHQGNPSNLVCPGTIRFKKEQFSDCCVTVLKHFKIFSNATSKEGFGFSCGITMSRSLIVLISRQTRAVALWSPTGLIMTLMFCS